ncbi:hypothetical protein C8Q77DRAFT_1219049 [Trametes polyzona]|nr:hypothetical protein C8Q77DRAFT_1219049 [Trametes polyzona]
MHAFVALVALAAAALQASAKPMDMPAPDPVITPPPVASEADALQARAGPALTIPLVSCLLNVKCCDTVLTLPVLPLDSLVSTLLPGVTLPIPIPTLGPLAGLLCSPATDLDILGNQCLKGGTPLCCQADLLDIVAEGCQEVIALPTLTLPTLPTLSLPPILGTGSGLLGLPPLLGNPTPGPTGSGLLGGLLGILGLASTEAEAPAAPTPPPA